MKIVTYGIKIADEYKFPAKPDDPLKVFRPAIEKAAECFDREPDFLGYPTYHGPETPDLKILMVEAR